MTSQGVGSPFAPGETIYGYQACGLKGTVYIGVDSTYGEKLMHISAGDEAVFRYVHSIGEWTEIQITGAGSGTVQVFMNEAYAGTVRMEAKPEGIRSVSGAIHMPGGEYELKLLFEESAQLEIMEIVLK